MISVPLIIHACSPAQASLHVSQEETIDLAGHRPANTSRNFRFVDMGFEEAVRRCAGTGGGGLQPVLGPGERYYLRSVAGALRTAAALPCGARTVQGRLLRALRLAQPPQALLCAGSRPPTSLGNRVPLNRRSRVAPAAVLCPPTTTLSRRQARGSRPTSPRSSPGCPRTCRWTPSSQRRTTTRPCCG